MSPTPVVRCSVQVNPPPRMDHDGGTGRLTVTTNRECTWTAKAEASWITVAPDNGQGEAQLTYTVAANRSSSDRTGQIAVNDRRVPVTQAGAPCQIAVSPGSLEVGAEAGRHVVTVTATSGCDWTAESRVSWIAVAEGRSGGGTGRVTLEIDANGSGERTGSVRIAGHTLQVTQRRANAPAPPPAPSPPACTVSIANATRTFDRNGGTGSAAVRAPEGCPWSSVSDAPWLTITDGQSGSGNGTVRYTAAANTATASRTATINVAGDEIVVTQTGVTPCTYQLSRSSVSFPATGGNDTIRVDTAPDCEWTATSSASWLTITSGSSGTGDGTVGITAAPHPGLTPRTATVTIAGQQVTVTQAALVCQYELSDRSESFDEDGGTGTVDVDTASACGWTATSGAPWLTITSGASGTGDGQVTYSVAPNTSADDREGTLTIAGLTVAISQDGVPPAPIRLDGEAGAVQGSCPNLTFQLEGRTVRTNPQTNFRRGSCNDLDTGTDIEVDGLLRTDGSVDATRVTFEN
ncbi:MAG TPA: BACON domain-containing carbohydrate-binding protein [Vicinamibacterales bacterium]